MYISIEHVPEIHIGMNYTAVFMGMAVMQFIFIFYQYILFRRIEFLYYLAYFLCILIYILFKSYSEYNPFPGMVTKNEVFTGGRGMLLIGYAMYFKFGRHFTETITLYKKLNKQVIILESVFLIYGIVDIAGQFLGVDFQKTDIITQFLFIAAIPYSLYVIIFLMMRKNALTTILVIGSGLLLVFGSASFIDMIFITRKKMPESYYQNYMEIGVFFELLFLNFGLIYKTRLIHEKNTRMEVERQLELHQQRMNISTDLHDEIGATLSGIALYTHLANEQIKNNDQHLLQRSLQVIQSNATEMVNTLKDIIWSVDPRNDSVEEMFQKLEDYLHKMATTCKMEVKINIQPSIMKMPIPMHCRKNIFLICKEALNNSVKYSGSNKIELVAEFSGNNLLIRIRDKGCGFDFNSVKRGNGLNNMHLRASQSNVILSVNSRMNSGTEIQILYIPQ